MPPSYRLGSRSALTLAAVLSSVVLPHQLAAMVDKEAGHASEFVGPDRHNLDEQFFVGQISAADLHIAVFPLKRGLWGKSMACPHAPGSSLPVPGWVRLSDGTGDEGGTAG